MEWPTFQQSCQNKGIWHGTVIKKWSAGENAGGTTSYSKMQTTSCFTSIIIPLHPSMKRGLSLSRSCHSELCKWTSQDWQPAPQMYEIGELVVFPISTSFSWTKLWWCVCVDPVQRVLSREPSQFRSLHSSLNAFLVAVLIVITLEQSWHRTDWIRACQWHSAWVCFCVAVDTQESDHVSGHVALGDCTGSWWPHKWRFKRFLFQAWARGCFRWTDCRLHYRGSAVSILSATNSVWGAVTVNEKPNMSLVKQRFAEFYICCAWERNYSMCSLIEHCFHTVSELQYLRFCHQSNSNANRFVSFFVELKAPYT